MFNQAVNQKSGEHLNNIKASLLRTRSILSSLVQQQAIASQHSDSTAVNHIEKILNQIDEFLEC